MESKVYYKTFRNLFVHNVNLNGLRALIYPYNLTASRYLENSIALDFCKNLNRADLILEAGSGHSIMPTFWEKIGINVIAIDINIEALKWQILKSKRLANRHLQAVLADLRYLPFKEKVFSVVSCISAIEHLPNDNDIKATREMGNVVKTNGFYILSFSLSPYQKSISTNEVGSGIPVFVTKFLGSSLSVIFRKFGIDRTSTFFARLYSLEDVHERLIVHSNCSLYDQMTFRSKSLVKMIHGRIIPMGVLTFIEFVFARAFFIISKSTFKMDAIIIRLRK